jgi:hypothetical protein
MADILCAGCARVWQHTVDEAGWSDLHFTSLSHTHLTTDRHPPPGIFHSISPSAHSPGHGLPLGDDACNG